MDVCFCVFVTGLKLGFNIIVCAVDFIAYTFCIVMNSFTDIVDVFFRSTTGFSCITTGSIKIIASYLRKCQYPIYPNCNVTIDKITERLPRSEEKVRERWRMLRARA